LDQLPNDAMADQTKKILGIMTQITFLKDKIEQLGADYEGKKLEIAKVDNELTDIKQVQGIVISYDKLVEYIVKLSEL